MNKKSIFITLVLLCLSALSACTSATATATSSSSSTNNSTANTTSSTPGARLNLNTVTADQLLGTIPNFPNRMVREFQEYRPYVSIQQFRREIGKYVGDTQVAEWEKYVYVPISINDSDSPTLQQIPGLDTTEAEALVAGRPYASTDDFLNKLSSYISADELTVAKSYLGE